MKQETEELIKWLRRHLNLYQVKILRNEVDIGAAEGQLEISRIIDAVDFLKQLPSIEQKLCFGGYIQDINGTLCCNGDKVRIIDKKGKGYYGRLVWSDENKAFRIQDVKERMVFYFPVKFEKE